MSNKNENGITGFEDEWADSPGKVFDLGTGRYDMYLALVNFAKGLREVFIGTALMLGALLWLVIGSRIAGNVLFSTALIICILVGVWKYFAGKQKCWEFSLAIPQRWLISYSFVFDLLAIGVRFGRRFWPSIWLQVAGVLFGALSFLLFVRFLFHLANIIQSKWGQRLAQLVFYGALISILLFATTLPLAGLKVDRWLLLTFFSLAGFLMAATLIAFLTLIWQLSGSLTAFADYLISTDAIEEPPDEESGSATALSQP